MQQQGGGQRGGNSDRDRGGRGGGQPAGGQRSGDRRGPRQGGPPHRGKGEGGRPGGGARPDQRGDEERLRNTFFANPYTFVPTPDRSKAAPGSFLGDYDPSDPAIEEDHSRFWPDRYTGRIPVELEVLTPLFITKTKPEKPSEEKAGHREYGCRETVPPTAIKGMLRSAYEAITNSRYGVFNKKQQSALLGVRPDIKRSLELIPGMIKTISGQSGEVQLLLGTTPLGAQGVDTQPLHAAWLQRYDKTSTAIDRGQSSVALRYPDGTLPDHRDKVRVRLALRKKPRFFYYEVMQIWRFSDTSAPPTDPSRLILDGYIAITGSTTPNKHHERVFFDANRHLQILKFGGEVIEAYQKLLDAYSSEHAKALEERQKLGRKPWDYLGDKPGETAFGAYVYSNDWRELHPSDGRSGSLLYVDLDDQGGVRALYPSMGSKRWHAATPWQLLKEEYRLRPATELNDLSPADRLFGWVNQGGRGAWRGKVRIGPTTLSPPEGQSDALARFEPMPLTILGEPKPTQSLFYAGDRNGNAQRGVQNKAQSGYAPGKKLRGRKFYWHHASTSLVPGYWASAGGDGNASPQRDKQEYRHGLKGKDARGDQNRSIKSWIRPGSTIRFDLHVENLRAEELGALLTLLRLPLRTQHPEAALRLGFGKALGFGSVRPRIVLDKNTPVAVAKGSAWAAYYGTLDGTIEETQELELAAAEASYRRAVVETYGETITQSRSDGGGGSLRSGEDSPFAGLKEKVTSSAEAAADSSEDPLEQWREVSFIKAFLAACSGPKHQNEDLPIHYPRSTPERIQRKKGSNEQELVPNYAWFVSNVLERRFNPGSFLPLPDAGVHGVDRQGLPYLPMEAGETRGRSR